MNMLDENLLNGDDEFDYEDYDLDDKKEKELLGDSDDESSKEHHNSPSNNDDDDDDNDEELILDLNAEEDLQEENGELFESPKASSHVKPIEKVIEEKITSKMNTQKSFPKSTPNIKLNDNAKSSKEKDSSRQTGQPYHKRSSAQQRRNYNNSNNHRKSGTILVNRRFRGVVHLKENDARLAFQPSKTNYIQPWANASTVQNTGANELMNVPQLAFTPSQLDLANTMLQSSLFQAPPPQTVKPPALLQTPFQSNFQQEQQYHQWNQSPLYHNSGYNDQDHLRNQDQIAFQSQRESFSSFATPERIKPFESVYNSTSFQERSNYDRFNYNQPDDDYNDGNHDNFNSNMYQERSFHNPDSNNRNNYNDRRERTDNKRTYPYENTLPKDRKFENKFNNKYHYNKNNRNINNGRSTNYNDNNIMGNDGNLGVKKTRFDRQSPQKANNNRKYNSFNHNQVVLQKVEIQKFEDNENMNKWKLNEDQQRKTENATYTVTQQLIEEEEDEETRIYRLKIEQQKREREKILKLKEERRLKALAEQQHSKLSSVVKQESVTSFANEASAFSAVKSGPSYSPVKQKPAFSPVKQEVLFPVIKREPAVVKTKCPKVNFNFHKFSNYNNNDQMRYSRPNNIVLSVNNEVAQSNPKNTFSKKQQIHYPPATKTNSPKYESIEFPKFTVKNEIVNKVNTIVKDEPAPRAFMSNRLVLVKGSQQNNNSKIIQQQVSSSNIDHTNKSSTTGDNENQLSANFFCNRTVVPKTKQALLNTRQIVINNLSSTTTKEKLVEMSRGIGEIQKLQLEPQERQATILFKNVASAHAFYSRYQRHMLDLSMIEVRLKRMI